MAVDPQHVPQGAVTPAPAPLPAPDAVARLRAAGRFLLAPPRAVSALLPVAWAALLWWASGRSDGVATGLPLPPWLAAWLHDLAHPLVFGLLALFLVPLLPRTGAGRARWVAWTPARGAFVLAAVVAYGFVDEWHQAYVPGRTASLLDLLSDTTGAACVLAVVSHLSRPDASRRGLWRRIWIGLVLCAAAAAFSTSHAWHYGGGVWPHGWAGPAPSASAP